LDVPVNTVKSWMHRAKRKLRKVLQMMEKEFNEQKLEPQFTQQIMEKGREYFEARKWDKAVHEFKKAAEIEPDSADIHHWLGRAYTVYASRDSELTLRDTPCEETIDSAVDEYKRAIELDPNHGSAHAHLAYLYHLRKGMIDAAVVEYKKAAETGGMDAEEEHAVYNNMGYIYRDKGMYEEALKWFDRAVRLDPSVDYVPWGIATVYAVQGKAHEAVEYLRQAVELGQKPERILRDDVSNELFDNIRETKEFQDFIRSIKR
jgi:tetratricopeptide (TPR) repeat protein